MSPENPIIRESTFCCAYCNSGGEKYSSIFGEGKCKSCGAPAGTIIEISRPKDVDAISKSVLVVYGDADKEVARRIIDELESNQVEVIDPQTVAENEQAGNKATVLSFLVSKARYTLVIPTKGFSSDRLVATAVETGLMGGSKIVPVYPSANHHGVSVILDSRAGVAWGDETIPSFTVDKDRFIEQLKK